MVFNCTRSGERAESHELNRMREPVAHAHADMVRGRIVPLQCDPPAAAAGCRLRCPMRRRMKLFDKCVSRDQLTTDAQRH